MKRSLPATQEQDAVPQATSSPSDYYLVYFSLSDEHNVQQFYVVTDPAIVKQLEQVSLEREPGCCSQSQCLSCTLGGLDIRWMKTFHLTRDEYLKQQELYDTLGSDAFLTVDDLLDAYEDRCLEDQ